MNYQSKNLFTRTQKSKADAIQYFSEKGDEYKLDLLQNLEDGNITFYTQGNFTDLCRIHIFQTLVLLKPLNY
jgi:threonyl-tRNA synthetase